MRSNAHHRLTNKVLLGIVLLAVSSLARADALDDRRKACERTDALPKPDVITMRKHLGKLYQDECLGGYVDPWSIARDNVQAFELDYDPKSDTFKRKASLDNNRRYQVFLQQQVLSRLSAILTSLQKDLTKPEYSIGATSGSVLTSLEIPLSQAIHLVDQGIYSKAANCDSQFQCADKRGRWKYNPVNAAYSGKLIEMNLENEVLRPNCPDGVMLESIDCHRAYTAAKRYIQYTRSVEFVLRMYIDFKLTELQQELALYDRQWTQYFTAARAQYPWELGLNSYLYARALRSREGDQAKLGLKAPPNHQWILLHPGIALEYVGDAVGGDRLKEALILEWVGYNRWIWQGATMRRPLGVSIVTAFSDRTSTDSVSHGLMVHYNHRFSLGVTQRTDGNSAFFVTIDLVKYVSERKTALETEFKHRFDDFR